MNSEVVTDQSIEDKLAAAYGEVDEAKQPQKQAAEQEQETQEQQEQATEAAADTEGEQIAEETPEEDANFEEAEYEGKTYKLPKELKEALLRQKDYTQKTQDVAERRRILEEQQAALQTQAAFQQQHFEKAVEVHTLQQQLQQFSQVDWEKLAEESPADYLKYDRKYRELERKAQQAAQEMQGLTGKFSQTMEETRQKAQAQCLQELKKDFPDIGPQMLKELDETGRNFGFSGQELASIADPRMIRVLHAAMQYKKLQGSKSLVEKKVQTAKPVQVQAARTSQSTQANAQLKEMKAKAFKTGKASDMENFLAMRFAQQGKRS